MEEIKLYLETSNPGFGQGFDLFCRFSRNQSLMSYIGRKQCMEMLVYELQKLAAAPAVIENPQYMVNRSRFDKSTPTDKTDSQMPNEVAVQNVKIIDDRKVNREELPQELKELYDEITSLYKHKRVLHEKMKMANSDTGRKEFREEILIIQDKISGNWEVIDNSLAGWVPEQKPIKKVNVNTNRAYISKMLAKKTLSDEQREAVKQKFEELLSLGEKLKPETLANLKLKGF